MQDLAIKIEIPHRFKKRGAQNRQFAVFKFDAAPRLGYDCGSSKKGGEMKTDLLQRKPARYTQNVNE